MAYPKFRDWLVGCTVVANRPARRRALEFERLLGRRLGFILTRAGYTTFFGSTRLWLVEPGYACRFYWGHAFLDGELNQPLGLSIGAVPRRRPRPRRGRRLVCAVRRPVLNRRSHLDRLKIYLEFLAIDDHLPGRGNPGLNALGRTAPDPGAQARARRGPARNHVLGGKLDAHSSQAYHRGAASAHPGARLDRLIVDLVKTPPGHRRSRSGPHDCDLPTFTRPANACYQCLVAKTTRCPCTAGSTASPTAPTTPSAGVGRQDLDGFSGVKRIRIPPVPRHAGDAHRGRLGTGHRGPRDRAGWIQLEQSVAVLGVGPAWAIGDRACGAVRRRGQVFAIGGPADRLAFARRMGATDTIGLRFHWRSGARPQVRAATHGRGVDVVIEAAARGERRLICADEVGSRSASTPITGRCRICTRHFQINRKMSRSEGAGSDFSQLPPGGGAATRHRRPGAGREMVSARYFLEN
ncbi:MAG: hypothetical protein R2882_09645 [Gemmatimonadales bacterium]